MSDTSLHMERSGARFELDSDATADVFLYDVVHGLVRTVRFNGHTSRPICVAEHSLRVETLLERRGYGPRVRMMGLLHDAAEAYVGDIPAPVKRMIGPSIRHLESRLQYRIWRALVDMDAAPADIFLPPAVHEADRFAFYIEAVVACTDLKPWDEESKSELAEAQHYVDRDPFIMRDVQSPVAVREHSFCAKYWELRSQIDER